MATAKNRCTNCKAYFPVDSMIIVPAGKFHNRECLMTYGMNKTDKVIKSAKVGKKKANARQDREFYDNDLSRQKKLTQTVFNKLRKLQEFKWFADRGLEPECISCGKKNMDWANGHFKTVGSQGALRYDPMNCFLQCNRYCNKGLSGNLSGSKTTRGYVQGLYDRFGDAEANRIIDYCEKDKVKSWECSELIKMRKEMNIEIRQLQSN